MVVKLREDFAVSDLEASSHGDDMSSASTGAEESAAVTLEKVVECLLRSRFRSTQADASVVSALSKLSSSSGDKPVKIVASMIKLVESGHSVVRLRNRITAYEVVAKSVKESWDNSQHIPSIPRVKSFILKVISDMDKFASNETTHNLITTDMIHNISRLVAICCLSAFEDVAVNVLLSPEFIGGKPTVAVQMVEDALTYLFSELVDEKQLSPSTSTIFKKLVTYHGLTSRYELISAIIKGMHRTGRSGSLSAGINEDLIFLFKSVSETLSSESIETSLYLLSLLRSAAVGGCDEDMSAKVFEIEDSILIIGTRGLDNPDCRSGFVEYVSIMWRFNVPLFRNQSPEIASLLLEMDAKNIWNLARDDEVVRFLTSRLLEKVNDIVAPGQAGAICAALSEIALDRGPDVPQAVLDTLEILIVNGDGGSVYPSVVDLVAFISLIKAIDCSVVSGLMISFLTKFVCNPATVVAEKFPSPLTSEEVSAIRNHARATLVSVAGAARGVAARTLLGHFLECLEHMPTVGISTVCHCICLLVNRGVPASDSMPISQAVIVVVWCLAAVRIYKQLESTEEVVESITSCLVAISGLIHPSLAGLWEHNVERLIDVAEGAASVASEFRFVLESIEFGSNRESEILADTALDTLITLLDSHTTGLEVKALLISCWGQLIDCLYEQRGTATVASRIQELLELKDVISASPDCVRETAVGLGKLADRRCDLILQTFFDELARAEAVVLSYGCDKASSVVNSFRIRSNANSFRGLFVTSKSEALVSKNLIIKEICLRGLGEAVSVIPPVRLSDMRVKDCIMLLLSELRYDREMIRTWIPIADKENLKIVPEMGLQVGTSTGAIFAVGKLAAAVDTAADQAEIDRAIFSNFQAESISLLLDILAAHVAVKPVLEALSHAVSIAGFEISSDLFSQVLEVTLHCLVTSVPDNPSFMTSETSESAELAFRCQQSALVVRSLFSHANSWMGFNRLVRAVFSLGASGAVPLVRWMCVRIVNVLIDETGHVQTDSDMTEFCETAAIALPRLADEFKPVRDEASLLFEKLMQRCQLTQNRISGTSVATVLIAAIPDSFVSVYLLHLIPGVHDADASAARSCLEAIVLLLSKRSTVFVHEASDAPAVVDAILANAAAPPTAITPAGWEDIKRALVGGLRFIAAVRFPIAVKEILAVTNEPFSGDQIHGIHSFARDRTTLVLLVKELMERMISGDESIGIGAAIALGHVLDCYDDKGVEAISQKYFAQMYVSLLVLLGSEPAREDVKIVIYKLTRAVGSDRIPSSVSVETGVKLLLSITSGDKIKHAVFAVFDFIKPFYAIPKGSFLRRCALIFTSQLAESGTRFEENSAEFLWNTLMIACEGPGEGVVETVHAMRGLRFLAESSQISEAEKRRFISLLNSFLVSAEWGIVAESLACLISAVTDGFDSSKFIMFAHSLVKIRRVVDHIDPRIRTQAFTLIERICEAVEAKNYLETSDEKSVSVFLSAVSDLWIPCVIRSQERSKDVRTAGKRAFVAILNCAVSESKIAIQLTDEIDPLLDLVLSEIGESSVDHLNSCAYYLLSLTSNGPDVSHAAAKLLPVLIELLPNGPKEHSATLKDITENLVKVGDRECLKATTRILTHFKQTEK